MLILSLVGLCMWACAFYALADGPPRSRRADNNARAFFIASDAEREERCRQYGAPAGSYACANPNMMILPNPCTYAGDPFAEIVCHELGHVNGWSPAHT